MRRPASLLITAFASAMLGAEESPAPVAPAAEAPIAAQPAASAPLAQPPASGLLIDDLRVVAGLVVAEDSTFGGNGTTYDVDLEAWSAALQLMRSFGPLHSAGAPIYGVELFYSKGAGQLEDVGVSYAELRMVTYGLTGHLGWAYQLPSLPIHAEATLFGTIGRSTMQLATSTAAVEGDSSMEGYGLRLASYYTFGDRRQLGLDLRYTIESQADMILTSGGPAVAATVATDDALSVALTAGFRY